MAGQIRDLIDELILLRSQGRSQQAHFVRAYLVLNGIDPDDYDHSSPDDADTIAQLQTMIDGFKQSR